MSSETKTALFNGIGGFFYTTKDEVNFSNFQSFAYFDGMSYQMLVINLILEKLCRNPTVHIFIDGRIDFGNPMITLEAAYTKSVHWANCFSGLFLADSNK